MAANLWCTQPTPPTHLTWDLIELFPSERHLQQNNSTFPRQLHSKIQTHTKSYFWFGSHWFADNLVKLKIDTISQINLTSWDKNQTTVLNLMLAQKRSSGRDSFLPSLDDCMIYIWCIYNILHNMNPIGIYLVPVSVNCWQKKNSFRVLIGRFYL